MSEEIEIMVSTVNAVVYIEIWTLLFSLHKEKTAIKSSIIDFFFRTKKMNHLSLNTTFGQSLRSNLGIFFLFLF